ncbi:MAG: hypothetical protein QOH93_61 [Chloroflexia bacterium]|nr:hypothetical protein [Chloroflexia bacterium]
MIHIELASYAHDLRSQMEEMQTMNSYYHPREHDDTGDERHEHCSHSHSFPATPMAYTGSYEDSNHAAREGDGSHPGSDVSRSNVTPNDMDSALYRVLVAVERGELSAEDAARKLEEMEGQSWSHVNGELL